MKHFSKLEFDAYHFQGKILLKEGYYSEDMMYHYISTAMIANRKYRDFTPSSIFKDLPAGSWIYSYTVDLPIEDILLIELMNNLDRNELWTNLEFMEKFRERLKFYKLYYDVDECVTC